MKKIFLLSLLCLVLLGCRSKKTISTTTIIERDTTYVPVSIEVEVPGDTAYLKGDSIPCPTPINMMGKAQSKSGRIKIEYQIIDNKLEIKSITDRHKQWIHTYNKIIKEKIKETIVQEQKAKNSMLKDLKHVLILFLLLVLIGLGVWIYKK